jgi:predicted RNA binding protein YcfA (HicA-like mRNA interferase family)
VSAKLPIVSGRQAVHALAKAGFIEVSQRGSHMKLRDSAGKTAIVPLHRELARGALRSIPRQAGPTSEAFVDLL